MKLRKNLLPTLFLVPLLLTLFKTQIFASPFSNKSPFNSSICDLKTTEEKLWIDHVSWTRSFIVSDLASLDDKGAVLERLLKNQDDIGNSLKPFYGETAGNELAALLREHIEIGGKVIAAAQANNKEDLEKYNKSWYENTN